MKIFVRLTFLFVFSTILLNNIQAQFGLKLGYNLGNVKYFSDGNFNEERINGYQIGALYHIRIGDRFSLLPEASYYTNGGGASFFLPESLISYQNLKFNGLVNYNVLGNNDGIALQVTGGFFASYVLSSEISPSGAGGFKIQFEEDPAGGGRSKFNRGNAGYVLGAGVKLKNTLISLRTSVGIVDLANFEDSQSFADFTYKSRDFSLVGIVLF